jgi:hypothetical protein
MLDALTGILVYPFGPAVVLKQNAETNGKFSTVEQNGENSIGTHPSSANPDTSGTCTSQSNRPLEVE